MTKIRQVVHGYMLGSLYVFFSKYLEFVVGLDDAKTEQTYPTRNEVIQYLSAYEQRYQFPVIRPIHVDHIEKK